MCLALFIASDEPLPFVSWDARSPSFHTQALGPAEQDVLARFTKPHVYFLGAHTGCACGFNYGLRDVRDADDLAEEAASHASVAALRDYVRRAVVQQGEVELFASWEADWHQQPEEYLRITPDWFGGERFAMPEKTLFHVIR
jgi:hypothetical protein